jgi:aldehyde dehydrogenase (NAD+)
MAETPKVHFESRMLIDGKLVAGQAGTFVNINPATEDVLGEVSDASKADMHRAIDAARRAFDETDWSTNRAFRKRCLEQLQEALEAEKEALREELILEAGCPRMVTHGLGWPATSCRVRWSAPWPSHASCERASWV